MNESLMLAKLTINKIVPSVIIYVLMFLITIAIDYILHLASLVWIGRYLGIAGAFLIAFSFIYSIRKRKLFKSGSPKSFLLLHEILGWTGAILICVHAGIHFNSIIPWTALFAMLIVVASGMVGKYLLSSVKEELLNSSKELLNSNLSKEEIEKELLAASLLVNKMQKWRSIHMPLTTFFVVFALIHIISILLLW